MLTLVMIVKNEASNIASVIESVRPAIDAWYILDTGSTDGTQQLVRDALAGLPGELAEAPFVDFATSRNAAIEGAEARFPGNHVIMLSGTETVVHPQLLRPWLENEERQGFTAFNLRVDVGALQVSSPRVFLPSAGWRYKGRYHEFLRGPGAQTDPVLAPCHIHYAGGENKTESWQKALGLLALDMLDEPEDARSVFYYAEVLRCLGRLAEAYPFYVRRVQMSDGYWAEKYISELYAGRILAELQGPESRVLEHYLAAFSLEPARAEALFEIAQVHDRAGRFPLAYLFACAAYEKPMHHGLFVETDIYAWKAADLVARHAFRYDLSRGIGAAQKAAQNNPGASYLLDNLEWYRKLYA